MEKKYKEVLKKISKKELEEFLLESLILDANFQNKFEMKFVKYFSEKDKEEMKNMFRQEWLRISDRGYISDGMGFQAMHILYQYTSNVEDILEDDIREGIKYVKAILEVIGEFQIDGSNGEHGDIIDTFKEIIEKIIAKANGKEKDDFINWLNEYVNIKDELYDFKDEFKKLI